MAATNTTSTGGRVSTGNRAPTTPRRLPQLGQRAPQLGQGGILRFAREVWAELKKVVWPSREEVKNLTIVVIAVSVAVGTVLGGIDGLFEALFRLILQQ